MRLSSPEDAKAIQQLLLKVFQANPSDSFLSLPMMDWKYWQPHPFRPGGRSYVIEDEGGLSAHGCLWPVKAMGDDGPLDGMHLIDWAATPDSAGAGLRLLKGILEDVDFCIAVGGSEDTRKILPLFGFRPANKMWDYVRPLRPLLQLRRRSRLNPRAVAKCGRNVIWLLRGSSRIAPGWTAQAAAPNAIPNGLWPAHTAPGVTAVRSAELHNYLARCPDASFAAYLLEFDGKPAGYFCLANNQGQIRMVDYNLAEPAADAWDALAGLCAAEAGRIRNGAELLVRVTEPEAKDAFERAGFRQTDETPILINWRRDSKRPRSIRITAIDNDSGYLHGSHPEFLT